MGWRGRRCMSGCAGMRMRAGWVAWRTGHRSRSRARIRWRWRWGRGWWRSGGSIRGGGRRGSAGSCSARTWCRCRAARACTGRWCAMAWSKARKRRRRRADYRRWERGRAMELWQMDVMGGVHLAGGLEVKVVTGLDDHSRFIVSAKVVARATARPVCQALAGALARHGVPGQILTDNGKVFTARFGNGPGPVLFDRICADNGIRHVLTAPYSPTTTGKVERLHKTMRAEFFTAANGRFATLGELQAALDAWVVEYNTARPHQSGGGRPPIERFRLANRLITADDTAAAEPPPARPRVPA